MPPWSASWASSRSLGQDDAPGLSALHLVRGDALRHLGRESDAVAAYQLAHQALAGGEVAKEVS